MPATTIGQAGLIFGVTAESGVGLVQSFTETRNADKVEARNQTGDAVGGIAVVSITSAGSGYTNGTYSYRTLVS